MKETLPEVLAESQITPFAIIKSNRRTFNCPPFTIDLDITDFGYSIGEVELVVNHNLEVPDATERIHSFISNVLGYPVGGVRGKVLEFLRLEKPLHYQKLVDCGLIGRKMGTL